MIDFFKAGFKGMNELSLILVMTAILLILFMPIPAALLDFLLLVNVSVALLVLFVTFYTDKPLEFSTFPSILLITTLFRLALNISATRLILDDAHAGEFIGAVGNYVVGGNYVIGLVIFLILIVVQYVVVTNGAQRVAEVAARFILDSLPGKQMSIDADLNMGLISQEDAKKRRGDLERESNFYGAMDGASKFVKGDAIAGIIIIAIDIIGGLSIGIAQHGMDWSDALYKYTLLTVGDGIVTQIPSLIIAVATGIIITRAATDSKLSLEIFKQFTAHSKVFYVLAAALLGLMLLPGMPVFHVFILVVLVIAIALYVGRSSKREVDESEEGAEAEDQDNIEKAYGELAFSPLEVCVSASVSDYISNIGPSFEKRLSVLRKSIAKELGVVVPALTIKKTSASQEQKYDIRIWGDSYADGEIYPGRVLTIATGDGPVVVEGIEALEPTYKVPAKWVDPAYRELLESAGGMCVEADVVLLTQLQEVLKQNACHFLTRKEVEALLEHRKSELGSIVDELIPEVLTLSDVLKVLKGLLLEGVGVRQLPKILEVLVDRARESKDIAFLINQCRRELSREVSKGAVSPDNKIHVLTLASGLENKIKAYFEGAAGGHTFGPAEFQKLLTQMQEKYRDMLSKNLTPVLICSSGVRKQLYDMLSRSMPLLKVVANHEVDTSVEVKSFALLNI